ncbi:hypothetical protein [[Eubacterium] cellulosolvens]
MPAIKEYPLQASLQEIKDKFDAIIEALTKQINIIRENREQWTKYASAMQKDMKIKLDIIRNLEENINLQKNLIKKIYEADLSDIQINVPATFQIKEFADSTLESIENMKDKDDPKLLSEIQSQFYVFNNGLLDYVEDLEVIWANKGNKALEDLQAIIKERNNLTTLMAYTIKDEY